MDKLKALFEPGSFLQIVSTGIMTLLAQIMSVLAAQLNSFISNIGVITAVFCFFVVLYNLRINFYQSRIVCFQSKIAKAEYDKFCIEFVKAGQKAEDKLNEE